MQWIQYNCSNKYNNWLISQKCKSSGNKVLPYIWVVVQEICCKRRRAKNSIIL